jgi:hypothetical protein
MSLIIKKPQILYAPMLGTLGGGSLRSFGRGAGGGGGLTLAQHYADGTSAGLQTVNFNGTDYYLNYATHASKGWVEILFLANIGHGHHLRDDQGNYFGLNNTGNPLFFQQVGSEYFLVSENTTLGGTALDYTADFAQIMLGNDITPTDLAITSKSSKTLANITATGQNEASAYPLVANSDLSGSEVSIGKPALLNYFNGTGGGVSGFYNGGSSPGNTASKNYEMYWSKSSFDFAIVLHNRGGSPQTDHWMLASGQSQSGSTYFPNAGLRGYPGYAYQGYFVGSWGNNGVSGHSSQYNISNSNVLSIWLTDM